SLPHSAAGLPALPSFPTRRSSDLLFGTLLDRVGAGNWLMQISVALLGRFRGGPAKVAVISSALNGVVSGSSVSNVVSGGIFTIPDRKSTRLNSSHVKISYAVFCLK